MGFEERRGIRTHVGTDAVGVSAQIGREFTDHGLPALNLASQVPELGRDDTGVPSTRCSDMSKFRKCSTWMVGMGALFQPERVMPMDFGPIAAL